MTRVLGIEGTAWAASAAVFDTETEDIVQRSDAYEPSSGGIHPREAAEHMHEHVPRVIEGVVSASDGPIDVVAFSRGPGLGPCLRVCGTAARTVAQSLEVPLVGVNHMVAHFEIGRFLSGFESPVGLNASGANAHVLGLYGGRYRVLGETMDTGVGNAIDKFARSVGWDHPGGPKVEAAAADGEFVSLPYVVKGMDFSFAGVSSAASAMVDDGVAVEDVCCGLQETVFAMLTEVAERALSLTGSDELVLGGGVGQNERLCEMLREMCQDRAATVFVPPDRFLRDNAGMVAVLGAMMYAAGDTLAVDESRVLPDYRPDQVPVTWRDTYTTVDSGGESGEVRGAEAIVTLSGDQVEKRRIPKSYRHPALDSKVRAERTAVEARLTRDARRVGVPTPVIKDIDLAEDCIVFSREGESDLRDGLSLDAVRAVGGFLARLHDHGIVHGDPTTRNIRVNNGPVLIDFGLGYHSRDVEDFAMDLHVFKQSLAGATDTFCEYGSALESAYEAAGDSAVITRLREIESRGRYQSGESASSVS